MDKMEALARAVEQAEDRFMTNVKLFGHGDPMTASSFHFLTGMKEAFKVVFGESYDGYVFEQIEKGAW